MNSLSNESDDQALIDAYQFTHHPFFSQKNWSFFHSPKRKALLKELHDLSQYNQQMLVVTGPKGSGKSTIRRGVKASCRPNVTCVEISGRQSIPDGAALLARVSHELQVMSADVDSILGRVANLASKGESIYLLLDDAHQLTDDAFFILEKLAHGDSDGRLHVFLFGEAELQLRFQQLQLDDSAYFLPLQAYTLEESREYIRKCVERAGQTLTDSIFTESDIQHIHSVSAGWPGKINEAATQVLIDGLNPEPEEAPKPLWFTQIPRKHQIAVIAILTALGGLFLFKDAFRKAAPTNTPAALALQPAPTVPSVNSTLDSPLPLAGQGLPLSQPTTPSRVDAATDMTRLPAQLPTSPVPLNGMASNMVAPPPLPPTPTNSAHSSSASTTTPLPVTSMPQPVPQPPARAPLPQPTPAAPPVKSAAPLPAPTPTPAPVVRPLPTPPAPTRLPTATPTPPPTTAPAAAPALASVSGSAGQSAWYLGQPVGHVTLQLLGTSSEATARKYASQGSDYHYFRKIHNGQPLYVVTYGRFTNPDAAKAAVHDLPANIQAGKPWPRTFASIQQEIRQAGR